jgi:hypothetical protein
LFGIEAREAGFKVENPKSIRIDQPVEDKNGIIQKTVTVPDYWIIDPSTELSMHVEVTTGGGETPHKEAQARVVAAAGVDNYVMITGAMVKALAAETTKAGKYMLLCSFFGWTLE